MPRLETFARDIQLATAAISPQNIASELAKLALSELSAVIQSGEGSPNYDRYVNGQLGVPENAVVPPGPILYVFNWWDEIALFALKYLIERSPVRTGRFKGEWIIRADGATVADPRDIRVASLVEIVNVEPYSRKIDVGHMKMSVPPALIEDARQAVMRIWGNMIVAKRTMIQLPGGYVLKGHFRRGIRPRARTKLQKDTVAGAAMTYPTLSMTMRV